MNSVKISGRTAESETGKSLLGRWQDFLPIVVQGDFQMKEAQCMAYQPNILSWSTEHRIEDCVPCPESHTVSTYHSSLKSAVSCDSPCTVETDYFDCCSSNDFSHAFVHLLAASSAFFEAASAVPQQSLASSLLILSTNGSTCCRT
jgi:hypothetical protein